jgi:hypothetical protein
MLPEGERRDDEVESNAVVAQELPGNDPRIVSIQEMFPAHGPFIRTYWWARKSFSR